MIDRLLKAKHWQLFLLVFVLPVFIYCGWLISFFSNIPYYAHQDFDIAEVQQLFDSIMIMIFLMLIPISIQYAWYWAMAMGLQKKLPEGMKMNVSLFKVLFVIPIVFLLLYFLFLSMLFSNIEILEDLDSLEHIENLGFLIFGIVMFSLLSLIVLFCSIYQIWFIAKTIKSVQLQKEAHFGDYIGEIFLVWLYPIGVWILQPIINTFMEDQ